MLIARPLPNDPARTWCLSVKFGGTARRPAAPGAASTAVGRGAHSSYSLQRLGVDYIDVYRPARLDPNVPIEDTVAPSPK